MNGGHDLGGMHGLGAVNPESETDEPFNSPDPDPDPDHQE